MPISKIKAACTSFLRNFLATFFYRASRSAVIAKIRMHGRLVASTYDFLSIIFAWLFACWVLIDAMADISDLGIDKSTRILLLISFYWKPVFSYLFLIFPPQLLLFWSFGLYRGFWRFASVQDLRKILYVSLIGGIITWLELRITAYGIINVTPTTNTLPNLNMLPRYELALLYSLFLIAFLSIARLFARFAKNYKNRYGEYQRIIIIGAGNAGEGLVRDLLRDNSHRYKPVAFVDDNLQKLGREIHGIRVVGTLADLPKLIEKHEIDLVLIAIPSASSANMRSVVTACEQADVRCYTLPGIKDLADGRVSINVLRSISLDDLLGRYPVTCQWDSIKTHLSNKTILITGGGGSIGSEICRQIGSLNCIANLIIIDSSEYNLYAIDLELRQRFPDIGFHSVLLNVNDRMGVRSVFKKYSPDFVFHAAAYKHVPLLENHSRVGIYNNIIGTCIIAEEAAKAAVEKFVLISSDKAVNPTNVMGATKRAAEYFCQNLNDEVQKTQFITVRFGNVLDSAGSVIPLFRKQIEQGGPVTVTHPEITRFFMTIPEASQLILQAAFLGHGGEIFVLDMGDPIKISYLAEQMIKLAGKVVNQDIKIVYTGLRPGEKLYEECFYPNEMLQPTLNSKILRAQSQKRCFANIQQICHEIETLFQSGSVIEKEFVVLLKKLVPEYQDIEAPESNSTSDASLSYAGANA